jgi:hypothetical protein
MTDKQNFEKDINTPNKVHACDICGAYYCNGDDCRLYQKYAIKEQECEELKKIIDEAKNSKLDLKSFLVGEALQNEYEQQLDQLKAENEELQKLIAQDQCFQNKSHKCVKSFYIDERYKQAIEKIKEIAEKHKATAHCDYLTDMDKILQKISEVQDVSSDS